MEGCCSQGLNRGKEESAVLLTNSEPRTRRDGEETQLGTSWDCHKRVVLDATT